MTEGLYMEPEILKTAELCGAEEYAMRIGRGTILISDNRECMEEQVMIDLYLSLPELRQIQILQVLKALEEYYVP